MTVLQAHRHPPEGSHEDLLRRIRTGQATTRAALSQACRVAASTVSRRVDELQHAGLLVEAGQSESSGGRRARRLRVRGDVGVVGVADLGARHVVVAVADSAGEVLVERSLPHDPRNGPEATSGWLWQQLRSAVDEVGRDPSDLLGLTVGLPAPVDHASGRVIAPSFMPSWHQADLPGLLAAHTPVPVQVENDANLVAIGEYRRLRPTVGARHLLAVKLGSRIGCGIVTDGRLHRGAGGAAGEISHLPTGGTAVIPCSCGMAACLESVASGGAVLARLRADGLDVATVADVVQRSDTGEERATTALRSAAADIGGVLAGIVNFHNPDEVVLTGSLSRSDVVVATIRAELYSRCLQIITRDLRVRHSDTTSGSGTEGAVALALDQALAGPRLAELLRQRR